VGRGSDVALLPARHSSWQGARALGVAVGLRCRCRVELRICVRQVQCAGPNQVSSACCTPYCRAAAVAAGRSRLQQVGGGGTCALNALRHRGTAPLAHRGTPTHLPTHHPPTCPLLSSFASPPTYPPTHAPMHPCMQPLSPAS